MHIIYIQYPHLCTHTCTLYTPTYTQNMHKEGDRRDIDLGRNDSYLRVKN